MDSDAWSLCHLESAIAAVPRLRFAHLPTPLDSCNRLSDLLGVRLVMKRDDCTGLAVGGNKIRQHEFIAADAVQARADCFIHGAAWQSNQSVQIAAVGAKLGMEVFLTPQEDPEGTRLQGNSLLAQILTSNVEPIPEHASSIEAKNTLASKLRAEGRTPYIVGMGSDRSADLAAIAYVSCVVEILTAWNGTGAPDWLFVTSAGSTLVGLDLACRILGLHTKVIGISPCGSDHESFRSHEALEAQVDRVSRTLGWRGAQIHCELKRDLREVGEGYDAVTDDARVAIRTMARNEGVLLDPTYTGRGFAGLLDYCRTGVVAAGESVVFVHTGGAGCLFAKADAVFTAGVT